ncbi:hypothetical protein NECAME_06140 [Necator americanus]|uniref:Uncharacterized protein n=1 Tax=Necator americanus TaxID=51031 RepID=W2TV48_NECAM|nr:hypothetical protein NECAME_06140 [Necator americanus]ETN85975.1 hypothetical protein NECAME_06140 [Necator americanus]
MESMCYVCLSHADDDNNPRKVCETQIRSGWPIMVVVCSPSITDMSTTIRSFSIRWARESNRNSARVPAGDTPRKQQGERPKNYVLLAVACGEQDVKKEIHVLPSTVIMEARASGTEQNSFVIVLEVITGRTVNWTQMNANFHHVHSGNV